MGKASKALIEFIEGIPDDKLVDLPTKPRTLYRDVNFRLDMQGMTSDDPPRHNLQIQVNYETEISTLKNMAPMTVAGPVLTDGSMSPQEIREAFLSSMAL